MLKPVARIVEKLSRLLRKLRRQWQSSISVVLRGIIVPPILLPLLSKSCAEIPHSNTWSLEVKTATVTILAFVSSWNSFQQRSVIISEGGIVFWPKVFHSMQTMKFPHVSIQRVTKKFQSLASQAFQHVSRIQPGYTLKNGDNILQKSFISWLSSFVLFINKAKHRILHIHFPSEFLSTQKLEYQGPQHHDARTPLQLLKMLSLLWPSVLVWNHGYRSINISTEILIIQKAGLVQACMARGPNPQWIRGIKRFGSCH